MKTRLEKRPLVIRREEVVQGEGHGGNWKIAYADFVTAMMAFFLVLWIIKGTTEEQRKGLADYFSPGNVMSHNSSGNGSPFGGHTPFDAGGLVSDRGVMAAIPGPSLVRSTDDDDDDADDTVAAHPPSPEPDRTETVAEASAAGAPGMVARSATASSGRDTRAQGASGSRAEADPQNDAGSDAVAQQAREEHRAFARAAAEIRERVRNDPQLAQLAGQLRIDETPEGLRIQILDAEQEAMFATGSAELNVHARSLLQRIEPVLAGLPNAITIAGHTDAAPYRGGDKTNWELSSERANATRRFLSDAGLPESRIQSVTGSADHDLLVPSDPLAAANRRIAIIVLRSTAAGAPMPAGGAVGAAPDAPPGGLASQPLSGSGDRPPSSVVAKT